MRRPPRLPRPLEYRSHHLVLFTLVAAALAAGALLGVFWAAGFANVGDLLHGAAWWWFFAALGGEVVAYVGYALAYREVARVEGGAELSLRHSVAVVATGFGLFVLRGGFAVDYDVLRRRARPAEDARARVFGLGAVEYTLLAPAAAASALYILLHRSRVPLGMTLPWILLVPVGFALAFWLLRSRDALKRYGGWRGYVGGGLDAVAVLDRLARRPLQHGVAAAVGMGMYWAGDIFCLGACLLAFGTNATVPRLILGYATGYALTRRTLPLAGAGSVEAFLPFALTWVNVPLAVAAVAVWAYRVFNLALALLPALVGVRHARG